MKKHFFTFFLPYTAFACAIFCGCLFYAKEEGAAYPVTAGMLYEDPLPYIVIDAGHGGEDSGCVGEGGILEKDINLSVAKLLYEEFEDAGYRVKLTREDDRLLYREEENIYGQRKQYDLKNRLLISKAIAESCGGNAVFISIHVNSYGDSRYSGAQVYYGAAEHSRELAGMIQARIADELQESNKRKIKPSSGIYLLERSEIPSVLVECGFISNKEEAVLLSSFEYQKSLAEEIFLACDGFVFEMLQ